MNETEKIMNGPIPKSAKFRYVSTASGEQWQIEDSHYGWVATDKSPDIAHSIIQAHATILTEIGEMSRWQIFKALLKNDVISNRKEG